MKNKEKLLINFKKNDKISLVIHMNFRDIQKLKDTLNIEVKEASELQLKQLKNKVKTLKDNKKPLECRKQTALAIRFYI